MAEASTQESVVKKDVKPPVLPSESVTKETVGLDENDLKELEAEKSVPYNRFKEINDEKKALQTQLEKMKSNFDDDLRLARRQAELEAIARREESSVSESVEPWERQLRAVAKELELTRKELDQVKGESKSITLNAQLKELTTKYPEADETAVLGWKKSMPHMDLEELMQRSHNKNVERVETKLKALIDRKKEKRASSLPVRQTSVQLKPEDKPKSLREAGKSLKRILGEQGFLK